MKRLLARHLAERPLLDLLAKIIDGGAGLLTSEWKPVLFPGDDLLALGRPKGLPIGNQTSQFLANVYLHPLDLFVSERIKPGLSARYVDDLVLFDHDRSRLHDARAAIEEKLQDLRLRAHPRKTRLYDVRQGLPFVGYRILPWGVRLPRETVTRFRQQMAAVADVGRPNASSVVMVPVDEALLAASGPATPSIAPLPNSSGNFVSFFSIA